MVKSMTFHNPVILCLYWSWRSWCIRQYICNVLHEMTICSFPPHSLKSTAIGCAPYACLKIINVGSHGGSSRFCIWVTEAERRGPLFCANEWYGVAGINLLSFRIIWNIGCRGYVFVDDVEYQVSLVARGPSGEYDTQVKQQTQSAKSTLEASIDAEYGSYQVSVRAINSLINMSSDPTSVMVNVYKPGINTLWYPIIICLLLMDIFKIQSYQCMFAAPVFVPQITVVPIDHQSLSIRWNVSAYPSWCMLVYVIILIRCVVSLAPFIVILS